MISFTSFPLPLTDNQTLHIHHPDVEEDVSMDLDDDQELIGLGGSKLTYPGESLTSSQAYMRYVGRRPAVGVHSFNNRFQRSRNIC